MIIIDSTLSHDKTIDEVQKFLGPLSQAASLAVVLICDGDTEHHVQMMSPRQIGRAIYYSLLKIKQTKPGKRHVLLDITSSGIVCIYFTDAVEMKVPEILTQGVIGSC